MPSIAQARRENRELRERLLAKNSTQFKNFFRGFSAQELDKITKAVDAAREHQKKSELDKLMREKEALENRIAGLQ